MTYTLLVLFTMTITTYDVTGRSQFEGFPSVAACERFAHGMTLGAAQSPDFTIHTHKCIENEDL